MVSGLTGYTEYGLSVVGVNYSGNAYNSTEITAWTEEGGTCNILKDVFFLFCFVFVVVFCCCFVFVVVVVFFLGGGGGYISCITGVFKQTLSM